MPRVSGEPAIEASSSEGTSSISSSSSTAIPMACRARLATMLVAPLSELTASHHSPSTRVPTTDPPMASGRHRVVALYRAQAAPT
jgi:hypothetical protein